MRKYFLLSAVALLATSTANATTDYAEVTAKATIEVAGTFSCSPINYGTIVVKQGNEAFVIDEYGTSTSDDLISAGNSSVHSMCSSDSEPEDYYLAENQTFDDVVLTNKNGDIITLINVHAGAESSASSIYVSLKIPADVKAGDYTGSFTVTKTY
ncbi:MAG: hypothetical protein E7016_07465 [Alphaproteobacteria bacterium]|nr:hypothetical protein [Alphaproteobacteria bacterium]